MVNMFMFPPFHTGGTEAQRDQVTQAAKSAGKAICLSLHANMSVWHQWMILFFLIYRYQKEYLLQGIGTLIQGCLMISVKQ